MSCSLTLKVVAGAGGDPPKTLGDSTVAPAPAVVSAVVAAGAVVDVGDSCEAGVGASLVGAAAGADCSETTRFPTIPASAWPGTVHSYPCSPAAPVLNLTVVLAPGWTSPVSTPRSGIVKVCGPAPLFVTLIVISEFAETSSSVLSKWMSSSAISKL